MTARRWAMHRAVAAVLCFALVACGGGSGSGQPDDAAAQMLANLPDCDRVPLDEDAEVAADVQGLVLPGDTRVSSVLEQGPLVMVEGTVRMTPLDVRAHYEARDDIDLLRIEDETFETEVLLRADGRRMYLLAVALCADGTAVSAMIGPDSDDSGLPEFQSDG